MGERFLMRWLYLEAAYFTLFFRPPRPTNTVVQALRRARSSEQFVRPTNGKNEGSSEQIVRPTRPSQTLKYSWCLLHPGIAPRHSLRCCEREIAHEMPDAPVFALMFILHLV